MLKRLSAFLNGTLVAGVLTAAALAAEGGATAAPHYNAFSCVRPVFTETATFKNGSFVKSRAFVGYLPCHETYETDKNGFMAFPEA